MKPERHILTSLLLVITLLLSCNNDDIHTQKLEVNKNEVSENEAKAIAQNILWSEDLNNDQGILKTRSTPNASSKEIESILAAPTDNNQIAFYIITYKGGGFLILAGDKRSNPILAFSENNTFPLNSNIYPSGLVDCLLGYKENIEDLKSNNININDTISRMWNYLQNHKTDITEYFGTSPNQTRNIKPDDPEATKEPIDKKLPLQTKWGQGCGYNTLLDNIDCSGLPCGKPYTGCVATAMAQIMRYYKYPTNYNWQNMPNTWGNNEIATLMKDIGASVYMKYKCNGSSADTEKTVVNAFKKFGYSNAAYKDYTFFDVVREIDGGRPVILKGGRNTGWWIFGQYSDGHAWVCDGYLINYYINGSASHNLYMNWGWDGSYNGVFNAYNFNPADNTFNYKTGMVYNIHP